MTDTLLKDAEMLTLSGNDIALALFACGHAVNWWKEQGSSKYCRAERAKYEALSRRLNDILDASSPLTTDDEGNVLDFGDERIMKMDRQVVAKLQRRLARAGAVR